MILPILNIIRKLVNKYVQVSNKFGFYLMASLIVLSTVAAAIPMSNMNLFENAMAMEMNPNMNNDNSHRYANYESYGANYYQ